MIVSPAVTRSPSLASRSISAAGKYNFPMDKVFVNIDRYGNTSAASIPLAMDEAIRAGRIGPGARIVLVAFGAGLTWAGSVVKL